MKRQTLYDFTPASYLEESNLKRWKIEWRWLGAGAGQAGVVISPYRRVNGSRSAAGRSLPAVARLEAEPEFESGRSGRAFVLSVTEL